MGVVTDKEGMLHTIVGQMLVEDERAVVGAGILLADTDPVELVTRLLDALELGVKGLALADTAAEGADIAEHAGIVKCR